MASSIVGKAGGVKWWVRRWCSPMSAARRFRHSKLRVASQLVSTAHPAILSRNSKRQEGTVIRQTVLIPAALVALAVLSHAAELRVANGAQLTAAQEKVQPGDTIILAPGDYGRLEWDKEGTREKRVTVRRMTRAEYEETHRLPGRLQKKRPEHFLQRVQSLVRREPGSLPRLRHRAGAPGAGDQGPEMEARVCRRTDRRVDQDCRVPQVRGVDVHAAQGLRGCVPALNGRCRTGERPARW